MICKDCASEGLKSNIYPGMGMETMMYCAPFYDESGEYHHHDYNSTVSDFKCSMGHEWKEVTHPACPNPKCDFGKA